MSNIGVLPALDTAQQVSRGSGAGIGVAGAASIGGVVGVETSNADEVSTLPVL